MGEAEGEPVDKRRIRLRLLELLSENHDFEKASVFESVARGFKTVFQVECAPCRALFIVVCARIAGFDVKRDGLFWIALLQIVENLGSVAFIPLVIGNGG